MSSAQNRVQCVFAALLAANLGLALPIIVGRPAPGSGAGGAVAEVAHLELLQTAPESSANKDIKRGRFTTARTVHTEAEAAE